MTPHRESTGLLLAISSIVATPALWFVQFVAMWLELSVAAVVVLLIGASSFVLPFLAFRTGRAAGAKVPQLIGGLVGAVALVAQVWVIVSITGQCGLLDGC